MELLFFSTHWGSEDMLFDGFLQKSVNAGYDGIEIAIPAAMPDHRLEEIFSESESHGLKVILQHYDTYEPDFEKHRNQYSRWLDKIRPFKPYFINSQTGKDFFSHQQNAALIDIATRFENENNVRVLHETHRSKFSYACHVTHQFLKALPDLRLTLDISHWVNVAESFLDDQQQAVDLAISRTGHIHSRVGYPEGPQVPDPRDPQWSQALEAHCKWWDAVVAAKALENPSATITVTPEFGPYPYSIFAPFTREPIANQWDINVYMMHLLRERWS